MAFKGFFQRCCARFLKQFRHFCLKLFVSFYWLDKCGCSLSSVQFFFWISTPDFDGQLLRFLAVRHHRMLSIKRLFRVLPLLRNQRLLSVLDFLSQLHQTSVPSCTHICQLQWSMKITLILSKAGSRHNRANNFWRGLSAACPFFWHLINYILTLYLV